MNEIAIINVGVCFIGLYLFICDILVKPHGGSCGCHAHFTLLFGHRRNHCNHFAIIEQTLLRVNPAACTWFELRFCTYAAFRYGASSSGERSRRDEGWIAKTVMGVLCSFCIRASSQRWGGLKIGADLGRLQSRSEPTILNMLLSLVKDWSTGFVQWSSAHL